MERVLYKLAIFYTLENNRVVLTQNGQDALNKKKNFYQELKKEDYLGGARVFDFLYDADSHTVLKL